MRGRVSAVNSLFIGTSNELGGFEYSFSRAILRTTSSLVLVALEPFLWSSPPRSYRYQKYGRLDSSSDDAPL